MQFQGAKKSPRHSIKFLQVKKRVTALQGFRGLHATKSAPAVERAAVATAHSVPSWAEGFVTAEEAAQYAPSQLEFLARKRGASPIRAAGTAANPQLPAAAPAPAPAARGGLGIDSSSSGGNWVDAFVTPEERAKFGQTHLEFLARLRGAEPAGAARPAPGSPAADASPVSSTSSSSSSSSVGSWVSSFVSPEEAAKLSPEQLEFVARRRMEIGSGDAAAFPIPTQQQQQQQQPPPSQRWQEQPARPATPPGVGRRPSSSPRATKYMGTPSATAAFPPQQPRPELYSGSTGSQPQQRQAPAGPGSSRPPILRQPGQRPTSVRPQAGGSSPSPQQRPSSPAGTASSSFSSSAPAPASAPPLHKELDALVERLGLRSPSPATPKQGSSGNGRLPGWVADFTTAEEAASLAPVQLEFVARKRRAAQGLGPIMPERPRCAVCGGKGQCQCRQCQGTGKNQREGHEIMRSGLIVENNGLSSSQWFFRKGGPCWLCRGGKEISCPECKGTGFMGGMEGFEGD
ncbi:hypothetical protein N2152v2_011205 [Parachlorella kessleri]